VKVYLVHYARDYVIAVYSTKEKADAWVRGCEERHPSDLPYSSFEVGEQELDEDPEDPHA
jgi:hypothetical protein